MDDETVVHVQLSLHGPDGPLPTQWAVPVLGQPGVYEYFTVCSADQALAQFKARFSNDYQPGEPINLGVAVKDE